MSTLDEAGFVLKSHVTTADGRLVLIDVRYATPEEECVRHGRHHIQEADHARFDEIMTLAVKELQGLQFINGLLANQ